MRVLSVIITTPSYKESGGVYAGLRLAEQLADLVEMEAAIMATEEGTSTRGKLTVRKFACTNMLGPLGGLAPRQLSAPLWKSPIPAYIARTRPDLVHFHNPFPPLALYAATEACRRSNIPFVISSHGFVEMVGFRTAYNLGRYLSPVTSALVDRPFSRAVRSADRVFILSPLEQETVARLGIPPERQVVVTNGVDAKFATPVDPQVRRTLAERLAWRSDVTNLLFVGNLTFNKGIDVLLQAMKRTTSSVRLIVAGALRSPQQAEAFLREAGLSRDDGRILFTDHVTYDELRALYQMSDIFCFPSRADTLPLVILEAMLTGLPVIASNVGGIPYQVTPDCGIVFPSEDAEALAAAIDALAADEPRRRRMGAAAMARVATHFSWTRSATVALSAYEELLRARRTGPANERHPQR